MSFHRIQLSQEIVVAAIGEGWPPDQVNAAIELLAATEGRFPPGVRQLPPGLVSAVQRERLLVAMSKAVSELGYRATNVQDVIERAGVSRPTFYEHFSNKDDCFLVAFDTAAARLRKNLGAAARGGGDVWRERLRLALSTLLRFVAKEPDTARTIVVEARGASPGAVQRRTRLLDQLAECLDAQARELLPDPSVSPITASAIVGGVEAMLYSRLCKRAKPDVEGLLPSLMYFAVLPYEGHEAASKELASAG